MKKKKYKSKNNKSLKWYKNFLKINLIKVFKKFIIISLFLIFCWILWCFYTLPKVSDFGGKTRLASTSIHSNDGNTIANYGEVYGGIVTNEEISFYLINAVIAIEDRRFYRHYGIDPMGILRALIKNLLSADIKEGGSTLTQQVAKLVFLTPEKTLSRKVKELMLSIWLEQKYSKNEILAIYLNRAYFGSGFYGISAASKGYFKKIPKNLSLEEAAILAGLLKAPSKYSPFRDKNLSMQRGKSVLQAMYAMDFIDKSQLNMALNKKFPKLNRSLVNSNSKRYFTDWVISNVSSGVANGEADIFINSTLDLKMQSIAEKAVINEINKLENDIQVAVVIMERSGAVRAMIGGRNWYESQFNRATQALRQPGSAFKIFVYLAALEKGFNIKDPILDEPIEINGWMPRNAGEKYFGSITLEEAFAYSSNSAAVKISQQVGRPSIIKIARTLGITSNLLNEPALVLGVAELSLLELTAAYAGIASDGVPVFPYGFTHINNRDGQEIWKKMKSDRSSVLKKSTIVGIKRMMKAAVSYGTGKQASLSKKIIYGKTGTSQSNRDAWFIGYYQDLVIGVWLGKDNDTRMIGVSGSSSPARIFQNIVKKIYN